MSYWLLSPDRRYKLLSSYEIKKSLLMSTILKYIEITLWRKTRRRASALSFWSISWYDDFIEQLQRSPTRVGVCVYPCAVLIRDRVCAACVHDASGVRACCAATDVMDAVVRGSGLPASRLHALPGVGTVRTVLDRPLATRLHPGHRDDYPNRPDSYSFRRIHPILHQCCNQSW